MRARVPVAVLVVLAVLGSIAFGLGGSLIFAHWNPQPFGHTVLAPWTKRYTVEFRDRDGIRRERVTSRANDLGWILLYAGGLMIAAAALEETLRRREAARKRRGDGNPKDGWG